MTAIGASTHGATNAFETANAGFALACNAGAQRATSDRLVFLNNDTVGTAGWLDALLAHAAAHPAAAVVGAKLLHAHNSVQHAGVDAHPSEP